MQTGTQSLPRKGRWTPCNTRARRLITQRKLTYSRIAQALTDGGIPVSAFNVANVVRGWTRRPDLRKAIADYLGKPADVLWPDFHDDAA
jgi:hypothetical protein